MTPFTVVNAVLGLLEEALFQYIEFVFAVDELLGLLPPYRFGRDLILAIVFGPAEDFEYVSVTSRPQDSSAADIL